MLATFLPSLTELLQNWASAESLAVWLIQAASPWIQGAVVFAESLQQRQVESLNWGLSFFLSLAPPFFFFFLLFPPPHWFNAVCWVKPYKLPEHPPASYARGLLPVGEEPLPFACFELELH